MFKTEFSIVLGREDLAEAVLEFVNARLLPEHQLTSLKFGKVDGAGDLAQYTFSAGSAVVVPPAPTV